MDVRKGSVVAGSDEQMDEVNNGSGSDRDMESAAVAAMMGFSSFGSKPNPLSKKRKLHEVATTGSSVASSRGVNTMPLGKPKAPVGEQGAVDVIPMGRGEEAEQEEENGAEQREVDSGVAKAVPGKTVVGDGHVDEQRVNLTMNTGSTHKAAAAAGGRPDAYNWQAPRKGVRNEIGDIAYYDASFVEDPWKHLGQSPG
ncbi:MAG: hypothetical protein Q9191_004127 [Dirinaria sp. TL-2023a]